MNTHSSPIRQRLKLATAPAHVSLEARIGALTTRARYHNYVCGLHAFRRDVETWLAEYGVSQLGAWTPQYIASTLRDDLSDLALGPIHVTPVTWNASSSSFALGVHYVLEGSALGARVLCKQVAALGMHRDHGARHLWAQCEAPANWRDFLDALAAYDSAEEDLVAGAIAAFDSAADAMERAAHV